MGQDADKGRERLKRQASQHVESLRLAGVQWLPASAGTLSDLPSPAHADAEVESARSAGGQPAGRGGTGPNAASVPEGELFDALPATEVPVEERRTALSVLAQTVAGCTRCKELAATRTQTVFGVGKPGVELCFVGEAPGADEDAQGEPFVGAAGQLLNRIIAACGMKREDVYICNIIKCRPPGNRLPLADEAAHCREYLEKQIELVSPKFICALGSTAAQNLLGTTQSIGKLRGRFHSYRGVPTICTYHPAYLLPHRSPDKKKEVWADMKMLLSRMGRPVE
jgi:DNA polymerase